MSKKVKSINVKKMSDKEILTNNKKWVKEFEKFAKNGKPCIMKTPIIIKLNHEIKFD